MQSFLTFLYAAVVVHGYALQPRDPGLQSIPAVGQKVNTFNNGAAPRTGEPPDTQDPVPDIYNARPIDLPFYRLYNGNMKFFPAGQLNTPNQYTDVSNDQGGIDAANQSACGIPDNAFYDSKVAIHPYFLKYADLSRYCMQDVCISFWRNDGKSDMILKVTDICSTDPNDPTHCATPADIKIDRSKAYVMEQLTNTPLKEIPGLQGAQYPEKTWWFFMKCWDDALVQPGYVDNWFAKPALPNNLKWAQTQAFQQYQNNQIAYKAKGWPLYPNGGYRQEYDYAANSPPISDWVPGKEPGYTPIAGGKGWGNGGSTGSADSTSPAAPVHSAAAPAAPAAPSHPAAAPSHPAAAPVTPVIPAKIPVAQVPHPPAHYNEPAPASAASSKAPSTGTYPLNEIKGEEDDEECDAEL